MEEEVQDFPYDGVEPTELEAQLYEALVEVQDAFLSFMDKSDWGKSFLDASTIRKANEAPIKGRNAMVAYRDAYGQEISSSTN